MKNKEKLRTYVLMLIFAAIIAGLYGAIHNQISYSLSDEYFTKFKFTQFGISWAQDTPRIGAAYVGIIASWWVGALICMVLGFFGLRFNSPNDMALYLRRSFLLVIIIAMLTGFAGLGYGYYAVNEQTIDKYSFIIRYEVIKPIQFIRVGFMHDAGYLGGVIGLLLGIVYLEISRKKIY